MNREAAINRSLRKRNPMLFPRDPSFGRPPDNEPYALGCDARNDGKAIDECPYESLDASAEWARGWSDADREREADEED